jgi:Bacterial Ig domain
VRQMRCSLLAFLLCSIAIPQSGLAQGAGGLAGATTTVGYAPVAFPQIVQLTSFNSITIGLGASDANGNALSYSIASGPSLGSLGVLSASTGQVVYTPTAGVSATDRFAFSVSDGVLTSDAVVVTILPPQPEVSLSTASLNFGSQIDGVRSSDQTITVSNPSVASLSINALTLSGANPGDFLVENAGTCSNGGSVAAEGSCTLVVSFTPSGTATRSTMLTIADNAPDSPQGIILTGTGVDYSINPALGGSTSASVSAGETAAYQLQVTPSVGFSGVASLSCTGAPALSNCTVTPSSVNIGTGSVPFSVSVRTTAVSASIATRPLMPTRVTEWMTACFFLALMVPLRNKWNRRPGVDACLLLVAISTLAACGGAGPRAGPQSQPGTQPGTYIFKVSGSSAGATRSLSLTITVL